jgi:hypothetical protein
MKIRQPKTDNCLLYWLIALAFAFAIGSCSSTKKTEQSIDISEEKKSVDSSSYWKQQHEELKLVVDEQQKEMNSRLQFYEGNQDELANALNEVQVMFFQSGIYSDSLQRRLRKIFDSLKNNPCKSKLIYKADGSIEAFGLRSANLQLEQSNKRIELLTDQLETEISKRIRLEDEMKAAEMRTSTEKQRGISGWIWSLWGIALIVMYVFGFWTCWKYKDAIQEQLDSENT